jgi:hypothetical protein
MSGHEDRGCSITLGKGEKKQYWKWLKALMPKKRNENDFQR